MGNSTSQCKLQKQAFVRLQYRNQQSHQSPDYNSTSCSADESSETAEDEGSGGASAEREDPDWLPLAKRVRKSSSFSGKTAKQIPGTSASTIPCEIAQGVTCNVIHPRPVAPPHHLVSLLTIFGWQVLLRPCFVEYVYISPVGITYSSLPKALDNFLQSTYKYKDRTFLSSRMLEIKTVNSNFGKGSSFLTNALRQKIATCGGNGNKGDDAEDGRSYVARKSNSTKDLEKPCLPRQSSVPVMGKSSTRGKDPPASQEVKHGDKETAVMHDRCLGDEAKLSASGSSAAIQSSKGCDSERYRDKILGEVRRSECISGMCANRYRVVEIAGV